MPRYLELPGEVAGLCHAYVVPPKATKRDELQRAPPSTVLCRQVPVARAAHAAHGRTLNTEIVLRLERSLDESDESSANALREYLQDELGAMRAEMAKMRELMATKK